MANQLTGKIEVLGNTQQVASKNGDPFMKRDLVLAVMVYDRYTGEVTSENHPQFEFAGKNCSKLDGYKVGDVVTVSFTLQGVWYDKDGERRNFTKVIGYDVQQYKKQPSQPREQAQTEQKKVAESIPPTPPIDKLPWE